MNKSLWLLPLLLPLAGQVAAQSAGECPQLPASTGLTWEHRGDANSNFCRALRADGTEAFGLNISPKAPFKLVSGNRAERSTIDGREVTWYRSELATNPKVQARETLVPLPDGRVAHIWLQAMSQDDLGKVYELTQGMSFQSTRLSSN
ncbi:MAG TPA: hypothetical protein VGD21_13895 [Lysobacter sp.]